MLPTNVMLKQELLRRKNDTKGLRHKKHEDLLLLLKSPEFSVKRKCDREYILKTEAEIRSVFVEEMKEAEEGDARKKEMLRSVSLIVCVL